MVNTKVLRDELWDLLCGGDPISLKEVVKIQHQAVRVGTLEDMLRSAIKRSSVGYYNGCLHFFSGRIYEPISWDEWKNVLTDLLFEDIEIPKVDYGQTYYVTARCTTLAKSRRLVVNKNLMVFRNGVLDTETLQFSQRFNKKFVQLWSVDYDYHPSQSTFMWHQFINQVLPDKEVRDVLQMFLGATFVDRAKVKIEHLLILLGKGANGKGVVYQVIKGVLGDNMSSESIANLCDKGLNGMASVARVNGKRLNFGTEMSSSDFKRRDAKLKALVSGEAVTARLLYGQPFEASDIPLLMSSANMIPYFDVADDALMRRIYPIPFEVVIPEERRNPNLANELAEEYAGIFNWILEGRQMFVNNGYKLPPEKYLKRMVSKGREEYESALMYMAKKGYRPRINDADVSPRNAVSAARLFEGYKDWCAQNHVHQQTKMSFFNSLEKEGFVRVRHKGGYVVYVFGDITLNSFKRDADALRKKNVKEKAPKSALIWIDGKAWVSSMTALAAYCHIGLSYVSSLNKAGRFEGMKKAWKEKTLYDVDACLQVMKDMKIVASDCEKELQQRMYKEVKYMRRTFNERMEYHNLPYRKYANEDQIDDSIQVVPDEMTDEEVFAKAKEELGIEVKHRKSEGVFGRGGKGFFESVDQIPTEEEKKMFNKK